jgi:hypothetical protein
MLKTLDSFYNKETQKHLTGEEFISYSKEKIPKLTSSLKFLEQIRLSHSLQIARETKTQIFQSGLQRGEALDLSLNPDNLSLCVALYGGSFIEKVLLDKNYDFASSIPNLHKLSRQYDFEKLTKDIKASYPQSESSLLKLKNIIQDAKIYMKDDPSIAIVLYKKGFISDHELFELVVRGQEGAYKVDDLLLTKLDKPTLLKLRQSLLSEKPQAQDALMLINTRLGYDFLFLPKEGGKRQLNEDLLSRMSSLELFGAYEYMIQNYPGEGQALLELADRLSLTRYLENNLRGEELVNAIYYKGHVNMTLLSKIADETVLKTVRSKLPPGFKEAKRIIDERLS